MYACLLKFRLDFYSQVLTCLEHGSQMHCQNVPTEPPEATVKETLWPLSDEILMPFVRPQASNTGAMCVPELAFEYPGNTLQAVGENESLTAVMCVYYWITGDMNL